MLWTLKKLNNVKSQMPIAVKRAMNRTVPGMKKVAATMVTLNYHVKSGEVKSKIAVKKATAQQSELSAEINSKGRPIRSIKFRYRANRKQGKKGCSAVFLNVSKKTSGGKVIIDGNKAFTATMKNGMKGIFVRKGEKQNPIQQVHSPSLTEMLNNEGVKNEVLKYSKNRFYKELDHEVKYLLERG